MTAPNDPTHDPDGIDRRGFLKCMAWAGTGMVWMANGGVLSSMSLSALRRGTMAPKGDFLFAQISDSHIGFAKEANPDVAATLQIAVDRLNALPNRPAFVLHTGDISQLSKPSEFDTADQIIRGIKTERVFYVPGEHDVLTDDGKAYRERYARSAKGNGWFSFDRGGIHFVGLVNVVNLKAGGLGLLGAEQLDWLRRDVAHLAASTPIVVFAHIPLWAVYPAWGWGTDDSEQALALLRRFGSVTVLNGHIHQTLQKVEGNVTFHTAMSTAFPQPAPGTAPSPGPLKVPADRLQSVLGVTSVNFVRGSTPLAIVDTALGAAVVSGESEASTQPRQRDSVSVQVAGRITIDNFTFTPAAITVPAGAKVTWVNADDVPHKIVSSDRRFAASPALDTGETFALSLATPGRYDYFCGLHPRMTGTVTVR